MSGPSPVAEQSVRGGRRLPAGEAGFWVVQAMVVVTAGVHLLCDLEPALEARAFPDGLPVALLIVPVVYAAVRYGLVGSVATGLWATVLWLPDLLLPHDEGHVGSDLVELALVMGVALFVGRRIESERAARRRAADATAVARAAEARYRQLFETNRSPLFVVGATGDVVEANPAARSLFRADPVGQNAEQVLGIVASAGAGTRQLVSLAGGRDYRLEVVSVTAEGADRVRQVVLDEVTEEVRETRRARWYADRVVEAEEDERRRLARELHDEPLQLFLHLARQLERLGSATGVPEAVSSDLLQVRAQAIEGAAGLRRLARGLRPPTLDQLGLVGALSSLVSDLEDDPNAPAARLEAEVRIARPAPEVELGLFRIAQEAASNAVRHAAASLLLVRLRQVGSDLVLSVHDDGLGFDAAGHETFVRGHLGLLGMAERARLLGGALTVTSRPGEGTVVEATIPLVADTAAASAAPAPTARARAGRDGARLSEVLPGSLFELGGLELARETS